jgi:hypothetical protein
MSAKRIEKLQAKAIENLEDSLAFLEEALRIAQERSTICPGVSRHPGQ